MELATSTTALPFRQQKHFSGRVGKWLAEGMRLAITLGFLRRLYEYF